MPVSAATRRRLETTLHPLITRLRGKEDECETRPLTALQLKEKVAECLRCWIADPIEGCVLRKEHVVSGMRLDDLVATPFGAGYMRGYRSTDGFCTIMYPWGHGFVHRRNVEKVQQVLAKHPKKRVYHEYVALEHQQLTEQVDKLLNTVPPAPEKSGKETRGEVADDVEEVEKLQKPLDEEHEDTAVVRENLGFLRRVDALATKVKDLCHSQTAKEPKRKILRLDEGNEIGDAEQQESDKAK